VSPTFASSPSKPAGQAAVLFSGGKDSALAALLLEPHYAVTLVTCGFGMTSLGENAAESAAALALPHERRQLSDCVLEAAVRRLVDDGYPNNAVQLVHEAAIERLAADAYQSDSDFDVIADGTRRGDRTPTVSSSFAQSVEDRFDISYVAPLAGFGRQSVDTLVAAHLDIETGASETLAKGDYETALRVALRDQAGDSAVTDIFPDHEQSRVIGRHQ
jgi:predicted subunit of tRNA(5-methylaminomethyl-2-thiouridylate) methyltransferase